MRLSSSYMETINMTLEEALEEFEGNTNPLYLDTLGESVSDEAIVAVWEAAKKYQKLIDELTL